VAYFADPLRDGVAVVVSPDAGGIKRAEQFREALSEMLGKDVSNAFMEKQRSEGVVSGRPLVGDHEYHSSLPARY
jgi:ribose-phosphate pyrophosphokinase